MNSLSLHGVGVSRDEAKRIGLVGFQIVFSESHVQGCIYSSVSAFPLSRLLIKGAVGVAVCQLFGDVFPESSSLRCP